MVSVSGEYTKTYPGWSGDPAALTRIQRVMEDVVAEDRAKALAEVEEQYTDALSQLRESALEAASAKWTVTMSVEERRMNIGHQGNVDEVIKSDTLDFGGVRSVSLTVGRRFEKYAEVVLDDRGAKLTVIGAPHWMRATSVLLQDEIRRNVPWWAWLRTAPSTLIVALLGYATFFTVNGWTIKDSDTGVTLTGWGAVGAYVNWMLIFIWPGVAWHFVVRRLLPGVEVVVPPATSRGRRAFAILGAFLISLTASLVANAL